MTAKEIIKKIFDERLEELKGFEAKGMTSDDIKSFSKKIELLQHQIMDCIGYMQEEICNGEKSRSKNKV